jgi:hypothetical protein
LNIIKSICRTHKNTMRFFPAGGVFKNALCAISVFLVLFTISNGAYAQQSPYPPSDIKTDWTAKWIWISPEGTEKNIHVYFRKEFKMAEKPNGPVKVFVSAATHYTLYVNGRKAGFGPPISDKRYHYYDTREIGHLLRKGDNVIAAHVYSLAEPTEDFHGGRGMFILQGRAGDVLLDTDSSWKSLVSPVWLRNTPRQSVQLHFVEVADLRKEPLGWQTHGFDASAWPDAIEIGLPPQGGYTNLVTRDLGEIDEIFKPAAKMVNHGEVERVARFLERSAPAYEVQAESFLPVKSVKFENIKTINGIKISTTRNDRDAVIVLDMGKMVIGCPFFDVDAAAGTIIDVSISEFLRDNRVLATRLIMPDGQPTRLTDRITMRDGRQQWQRDDYNGYRFIQLTIRNARKPVTIRGVGTVQRLYRFAHEATFTSSDDTLNRIFDAAKWSHRVNTHWGYCGSAWREHAQWSDLAWSYSNSVVFQDFGVMSYYLHQTSLSQNDLGRMAFPYPGHQGGELPEQTMWIADDLYNVWMNSGHDQIVRDLLPAMVKADKWFRLQTSDGLLLDTSRWLGGMWLVVDWGYPHVNNKPPGKLATLNMFYYEYLRNVQLLAAAVGEKSIESTFRGRAGKLMKQINKTYYDSSKKLYYEMPGHVEESPFASTLAVQYGVAPAEDRGQVFAFAVGNTLRPGKASPWFMFNALEAFGQAGRYTDAVASIKKYWGPFLNNGSMVFWELWNKVGEDVTPIDGYTTEMVGQTITYASAPAPYIVRYVLGVQPVTAGFEAARIAPHFSGLKYASGTAPTPRGDITVKWDIAKKSGRTTLTVIVPESISATIEVPYSVKQTRVTLNNKLLFDGKSFHDIPGVKNPGQIKDAIYITVEGGKYVFES